MENEVKKDSSEARPAPRRMRILRGIARFFLVVLIFFILLELFLQAGYRLQKGLWYPVSRQREFPAFYCHDDALGWRLCPDLHIKHTTSEFSTTVNTDGAGFRIMEGGGAGDAALIAGDSFAFGWGVDASDSFGARLGRSTGVSWYSCGVPGYGLEQEERLLAKVLLKNNPSLILLEVWPVDWDILNSSSMAELNGYLVQKKTLQRYPRSLVSLRIALFQSSIVFGFFDNAGKIISVLTRRDLVGGFGLDAFEEGAQQEIIVDARKRAFGSIKSMKKQADSRGIPFVVVVVPSVFQIFPDEAEKWIKMYGISGTIDVGRPDRELKAFAAQEGICMIELAPHFQKYVAEGGERPYYHTDPHWTPGGHALAADVIREFLRSHRLLKYTSFAPKKIPRTRIQEPNNNQ